MRPNARGVLLDDYRQNQGLHAFEGRDKTLSALARWTSELADDPVTRIVTGGPGSGKTSVLARFDALADPVRRGNLESPSAIRPPDGCVALFIQARGRTTTEIADGILHTAGLPPCDVRTLGTRTLLAGLDQIPEAKLVVIDALDESADPEDMIHTLLGPLPTRSVWEACISPAVRWSSWPM